MPQNDQKSKVQRLMVKLGSQIPRIPYYWHHFRDMELEKLAVVSHHISHQPRQNTDPRWYTYTVRSTPYRLRHGTVGTGGLRYHPEPNLSDQTQTQTPVFAFTPRDDIVASIS